MPMEKFDYDYIYGRKSDKVIISVAITGALANRYQNPGIPYTPEEMAEETYRAYNAGASIVHIHARERDGTPSIRPEMFKEITEAIKAKCDIIINYSTGAVGIPREMRIEHIRQLKPDIGALNMGSMNYSKYSTKRKDFVFKFVFENTMDDIMYFINVMNEVGTKPELESFDAGHIANSYPLIDMGLLKPPVHYSIILGVLGGAPPTVRMLQTMVDLLPPSSHWQIIGIGPVQWRLVAAALAMGGDIRVGLEDNFYLGNGEMATSNGPLVEQAARMARDVGREPATVEEAREILGLKKKEEGDGS